MSANVGGIAGSRLVEIHDQHPGILNRRAAQEAGSSWDPLRRQND
jgi:hypothetical protein